MHQRLGQWALHLDWPPWTPLSLVHTFMKSTPRAHFGFYKAELSVTRRRSAALAAWHLARCSFAALQRSAWPCRPWLAALVTGVHWVNSRIWFFPCALQSHVSMLQLAKSTLVWLWSLWGHLCVCKGCDVGKGRPWSTRLVTFSGYSGSFLTSCPLFFVLMLRTRG